MTVAVGDPWTYAQGVQTLGRDPFPAPAGVQGKLPGDQPSSHVQKGEQPRTGGQGGERLPKAEEQYVQRPGDVGGCVTWLGD